MNKTLIAAALAVLSLAACATQAPQHTLTATTSHVYARDTGPELAPGAVGGASLSQ